jgi:hypothetical protein
VQSIAVAECVGETADDQLGRRVARFDRGHYAGAFGIGKCVGHGGSLAFRIWEQREGLV